MSSRNNPRGSDLEQDAHERGSRDSMLCQRILGVDLSIRIAAVIEGDHVTGFASTARANDVLGKSDDLREKLGRWSRVLIDIGRRMEPAFGGLESITFTLGGFKHVTIPISETRCLGLSLDKFADEKMILPQIAARLDLNGPRDR
jgi:hypothetical protein